MPLKPFGRQNRKPHKISIEKIDTQRARKMVAERSFFFNAPRAGARVMELEQACLRKCNRAVAPSGLMEGASRPESTR
ncbi:MAG TPA: hypothetical protein DCX14_04335 [Flavobacteriales bacterium]|nr:hypothetical protein [Flavobacteriales bacterium]